MCIRDRVKAIKEYNPDVIVQYHGHSGPGFSPASMLEVARAGADILDCAVEPLAWGKIHPDVITIQAMLKADGFDAVSYTHLTLSGFPSNFTV